MMKIAAIVGSLRKDSFNLQLTLTIQDRYRDQMTLNIPDIGKLPLFNQDDELAAPPQVDAFKKAIAEVDGVILVTPEYNWSVPGVLKNALDWLSRVDKVLIGKPTMTVGASTGMFGTIRAQQHLREILASPGLQAKLLPPSNHEVYITQAAGKFDPATRRLTDERSLQSLDKAVADFIQLIQPQGVAGLV
ncbi:MAG: NAD(P)H-dependent oxidoreductase [Paenibacillaceae bacterium]|jgi:NAD(P)H-dependent FMN reductase|nr:NAD(P)H-dependent oxidoreductase [Paenibacillaceae bacterium]